MTTLHLRGEFGRQLTVAVHSYERVEPQDPYDANWLRCSVQAELGSFQAALDASFTTQDFARFLSDLDGVVSGATTVASFDTMENALSIRVEVDRVGRAVVTGKLREVVPYGSELSFTFESDHSFLAKAHSDLKRLVAEFPERVSPPEAEPTPITGNHR